MKLHTALLALTLLAATTADAASPATSGALGVPANDIAGLWSTVGTVAPCAGGSSFTVRNTLLFQAGGAVIENPRFSPPSAPIQRGIALGTWSYEPASGEYNVHLLFDWYVNGIYQGYATVDREILLSNDGQQASGPVRSTRYMADGSTVSEVCGSTVSQRL